MRVEKSCRWWVLLCLMMMMLQPSATSAQSQEATPLPPDSQVESDSLSAAVVIPALTVNNSAGPVVVTLPATLTLYAVGMPSEGSVSILRYAGVGCLDTPGDVLNETASASGTVLVQYPVPDPGMYSFTAQSGDVTTGCVNVSASLPNLPAPQLTINGNTSHLTVPSGTSLTLLGSGLVPGRAAIVESFAESGCAGTAVPGEPLIADAGGSVVGDLGVAADGDSSFRLTAETGNSNCVDVHAGLPATLLVNESVGPVTVAPDADITWQVMHMPVGAEMEIRKYPHGNCSLEDGEAFVSIATTPVGGDGTATGTTSLMAGGEFGFVAFVEGEAATQCVTVTGVPEWPPLLSIDNETVSARVTSLTFDLLGSNLIPDQTSGTFVDRFAAAGCTGDAEERIPVATSFIGAFGTTVTLPDQSTWYFQIEQFGIRSNCLEVIYDSTIGDPPLALTVNGSSTGIEVSSPDETYTFRLSGLYTGDYFDLRPFGSAEDCEVGLTGANIINGIVPGQPAGFKTLLWYDELGSESPVWYRMMTDDSTSDWRFSNCVSVSLAPPAAAAIPLTVNGGAGPVYVQTGEYFELATSGLNVGEVVDLYVSTAGSCTIADMTVVGTYSADFDGVWSGPAFADTAGERTYVLNARLMGISNCVYVNAVGDPAFGPLLSVNNDAVGPVTVAPDAQIALFASSLPPGDGEFVFYPDAACQDADNGSSAYVRSANGTAVGGISLAAGESLSVRAVPDDGAPSNCVAVMAGDAAPQTAILTANNNLGPLTVETGDTISLFATGLPLAEPISVWRFDSAGCTGASTLVPGAINAAGYEATTSFDTGVVVWFHAVSDDSGVTPTNCVEVLVEAPVPPVLSVNGNPGPVTVSEGDTLDFRVSGIVGSTGISAAAVPVEISRYDGDACAAPGTTIASGDSDATDEFQASTFADEEGTFSFAAQASGLASNCVVVEVEAVEVTGTPSPTIGPSPTATEPSSPTATPNTSGTATVTPNASTTVIATTTSSPTATPPATFDPGAPGNGGGDVPPNRTVTPAGSGGAQGDRVTALPSTGSEPTGGMNAMQLMMMFVASGCAAMAVYMKRKKV